MKKSIFSDFNEFVLHDTKLMMGGQQASNITWGVKITYGLSSLDMPDPSFPDSYITDSTDCDPE